MIKLIASDMDGTLLNDKMQISAGNVAAIKQAQAKGVEFLVATGRELKEAKPLVEAAGLHTGYITLNGARVFNTAGELVVDLPIKDETALKWVHELKEKNFYFELVTSHGVYSDDRVRRIQNVADLLVNLNPDTNFKTGMILAAARLEIININYTDDYQTLLDDPETDIYKIIVFDSRGQSAFEDIRTEVAAGNELIVTSSSANNIEINNIKAQKGLALTDYANERGIAISDVMAIGDNLNDESMIRMAGVGVAMGNAIDYIKEIADDVTTINTKDGVGAAILKHIAE